MLVQEEHQKAWFNHSFTYLLNSYFLLITGLNPGDIPGWKWRNVFPTWSLYIHIFKIDWLIWTAELERERGGERVREKAFICWFMVPMARMTSSGPGWIQEPEASSKSCRGPRVLDYSLLFSQAHSLGTWTKVKQPGLKPASIWDASVASSSLNCHTTIPTPVYLPIAQIPTIGNLPTDSTACAETCKSHSVNLSLWANLNPGGPRKDADLPLVLINFFREGMGSKHSLTLYPVRAKFQVSRGQTSLPNHVPKCSDHTWINSIDTSTCITSNGGVAAVKCLLTTTPGWTFGFPWPHLQRAPCSPVHMPWLSCLFLAQLPAILLSLTDSLFNPSQPILRRPVEGSLGSKKICSRSKEPPWEAKAFLDQSPTFGLIWISMWEGKKTE